MIHAICHHGWIDVERYEALRQKRLSEHSAPAQATSRRGKWSRLEEGSTCLELLRFLDAYKRQHGQMPTVREIAAQQHLELSSDGHASYALSALEHGGWIQREFGVPRGIRITDKGRAALEEVA